MVAWLLYALPVTGPYHTSPGYTLASGYELLALEQEIITAMTEGSAMAVRLAEARARGTAAPSDGSLACSSLCHSLVTRSHHLNP